MEHWIDGAAKKFDPDGIDRKIQGGASVSLQFPGLDHYNNDTTLRQLDQLCAKHGERLRLRFYWHDSDKPFDFKVLLKIPHLTSLCVDCMESTENTHALKELKNLRNLELGIELKEPEILKFLNSRDLTSLMLGGKNKSLDLKYLGHFEGLRKLSLGGHQKNIEAVGELAKLESLSLVPTGKAPVSFVNHLKRLRHLEFVGGSKENIDEIEVNAIEHLEIHFVRGFNDVGDASRFHHLKQLHISDNIRLAGIRFGKELPFLEVITIKNCKTLGFIEGFEKLPSLKHVWIWRTNLDFNNINHKLPASLKNFSFFTSSKKENDRINSELRMKGYNAYSAKEALSIFHL
ncbi:MAG: hypothetical protein FWC42_06500 [Proteobacteria bacterium]|nr:hypothetical protein [Pseudomonadota bacterium]